MELGHVSVLSITGMIFTLCISAGLPIALLLVIRKKTKVDITSFFIGVLTFIVFVLVLEQILHTVVGLAAGDLLKGNIWAYALYGGLAAGLFEETGRFIAMYFFMKKNLNMPNALMYGAGHGGAEAVLLIGMTYVNNIVISFMLNTGLMDGSLKLLDEAARAQTIEQLSALWTLPSDQFFLAGIERVFAIILHIALSVLVYQAIKNKKIYYWLLAVGMHAAVDIAAVVTASYLNTAAAEISAGVLTAAAAVLTMLICRKNSETSVKTMI